MSPQVSQKWGGVKKIFSLAVAPPLLKRVVYIATNNEHFMLQKHHISTLSVVLSLVP